LREGGYIINAHIVPATYLRSWKAFGTKQSVYVFDKDDTETVALNTKNVTNLKGTSFTASSRYYLILGNVHYMKLLRDEYALLYDTVKQCQITIDGSIIKSFDDFLSNFTLFDEWKICCGSQIFKNKRVWESFKKKWSDHMKNIERYLDEKYERKWFAILSYLDSKIMKRSWQVKDALKDDILKHMAIQVCRVFSNTRQMGIDIGVDYFASLFDDENIKKELTSEEVRNDFSLSLLYRIYRYEKYQDEKKNGLHLDVSKEEDEWFNINMLTSMYDTWKNNTLVFLRSPSTDFVTSDNPVIHVNDDLLGGIYFPATPKLCILMIHNRDRDGKHKIVDISDHNVKFINTLIKRNARSVLAYTKNTLQDAFRDQCDITSWKKSFAESMLEICWNPVSILSLHPHPQLPAQIPKLPSGCGGTDPRA
jgi:hypothetical protein